MALNLSKIQELAKIAADQGADLNNAQSGGGDYEPPVEGACRARLVGYVEVGTHTEVSRQYGEKTKPRCELTFELSGPKHEPKDIDGVKYPHRIVIKETVGFNEKNGFIKLFKMLNAGGTARTFLDLLGQGFRATVVHRKYKGNDGKERIAAQLKNTAGYTFSPATYEDPETNEVKTLKIAPAITPLKALVWNNPDIDQWDSIFVDGSYDDGGSKNKLQLRCVSANDFKGSALERVILEAGRTVPVPSAKTAPAGDDGADDGDGDGDAPAEAPTKAPVATTKARTTKAKPTPAADDADPLAGA